MSRGPLLVALLLGAASPSLGQSLPFTVDSSVSVLDLDVDFELRLPGTLIGDHDPVSNPGGTQTRPGLFGGSGNQPINIQLDLVGTLDVPAVVQGSLEVDPELLFGVGLVDALDLDLVVGGAASADLLVRITYDTFRTFSPNSLFPSLVPIELPLGQVAIGDVTLTQTAAAPLVLTPTATPGVVDALGLVPVDLEFVFDFNGQPTPVGPLTVAVPLQMTIDLGECDATLVGGVMASDTQTVPAPAPLSLTDVPLPLPTLLPPGAVANLLLNADLDEIAYSTDLDITLEASAPSAARIEPYCTAAPNSAGPGALLDVLGTTSIAADDIVFAASGLPPNGFGFLLMGEAEAFVAGFGGSQGNLCLAGNLYRFSERVQFSGPGGAISFDPDLTDLPAGVVFQPGETWRFQYWYRDANPTLTSNTTDAARVTFCR